MVRNAYPPKSNENGWVAFTVPTGFESAPSLALQFKHDETTVRWGLPDEAAQRIAGPRPTFELVSFEGPKQVPENEVAELAITARNTSSVDGVFRGCLNMTGMYSFHEFSLPIEAGAEETATQQLDVSSYVREPNASFSCFLRTTETERKLSIGVVPKSDGD